MLAYARTVDLWGRTTNFLVELPYSAGTTKGLLLGVPVSRDFSDFGDLSVGLNVNLRGAPTMNKEEFMAFRANPRPIIGASLKVQIPTGQYDSDKLINVGTNRWAARLKLGSVMKLKSTWLLELSASAWFFGDDNDFVMGKKEQEPIFAAETNIIKRIRPGLWASLDITYYRGGRQTIDGNPLRRQTKQCKTWRDAGRAVPQAPCHQDRLRRRHHHPVSAITSANSLLATTWSCSKPDPLFLLSINHRITSITPYPLIIIHHQKAHKEFRPACPDHHPSAVERQARVWTT